MHDIIREMRSADRRLWRSDDGGRDLSSCGTAGDVLRCQAPEACTCRSIFTLYSLHGGPSLADAIEDTKRTSAYGWPNWVLGNHDNPRIASRLAELNSENCRDAVAHAARHADALLWRRDRDGAIDDSARTKSRDPFEKTFSGLRRRARRAAAHPYLDSGYATGECRLFGWGSRGCR